ncbi:MAG: hypothetical protein ACTSPO_15095 [Candidatus Heimdallarchaeaceae archaeon]
MAKPYQNATSICAVLTLLAVVGIISGFLSHNPLIIIIFLFPTVVYEVYRTEGRSTKASSWFLLLVFILEAYLIITNTSIDLAGFLGGDKQYLAGYAIPLGDIKVVGPTVMAVLSIILFTRTRGRYTRWLAVIIFVTSFAIVYVLDPSIFGKLLKLGVKEGLDKVQYY